MGTVPRQESHEESVPISGYNPEQLHAPSGTFKMALLICLIFSAFGARGKNKNMIRPLALIFLRGLLVS
jgi:hypothetical protein